MSQIYLINFGTFAGYEDLSINIKAQRMLLCIKKAQDLDLRLFMGAAFYTDFISYCSNDANQNLSLALNTPQTYKDMFNGLTYTDQAGNKVGYDGMIPALVYWSFARFIESDSVHYTPTGPMVKRHEDSDALNQKDIVRIVQQQRSVANAHANDIEMFLYNNKANYPLWRMNEQNKSSRQSGPRIRGIDRTNFNLPGYNNGCYPWDNFNTNY